VNTIIEILRDHIEYRKQIFKLAKTDIIKTYKGSALGWLWAIISPSVQIFVYWFAFSFGLRNGGDVEGYPFFLWLIAGMIPWFYMRSMLPTGAGSIRKYSYMVTKIKFPISTIPTFVSMAEFAVNMGLTLIMIVLFMLFGFLPDIYFLQLPLYILLMFMFFTAWALFASMIAAFSRDFLNLIKSLTTALFWLSGIMYDVRTMDIEWIKNILLFNPITIIINGYRNTFIYKQWFWEDPQELINFFLLYVIMIILAVWAYRRLRRDIPDVL